MIKRSNDQKSKDQGILELSLISAKIILKRKEQLKNCKSKNI